VDSAKLPSELISELERMPSQFEELFHLVPTQGRRWKPESWGGSPGENFSALEHACHLRDIERDGYQVRIQRLLQEDEPTLVSIDGYELASVRRYEDEDPAEVLEAFRDARRTTVGIVRDLRREQLDRTGVFAEYGRVSLQGLIHFLRGHDQQHLACLQWLLGKMASRGEVQG
jgi:hypothetical protein